MASLDTVLNLYKRKSETPLQTIERFTKAHPEYKGARMTYAGRLDPMAEGVLVVLAGEKNKEREAYTGLDKDYTFEFVLGVETDTFDALGRIVAAKGAGKADKEDVAREFAKYQGVVSQAYPSYSSKVVEGIPLFERARTGKLVGIELPKHEVHVKRLSLVGARSISRGDLWCQIEKEISAVKGDFRQKETLALWDGYFASKAPETFIVFKAEVSCGSGFYVRQLVSDIGKDLGTGAMTLSILRTRVGEYRLEESIDRGSTMLK